MAAALARQAGPEDRIVLFSSSWKDRLLPGVVAGADTVDRRIPVSVLNLGWHRLEWPPVEHLAGETDVAWSLHPLLMPAARAAQVITIHDLFFLEHPDATAREIRRDYAALAARHARRADGIITISEHTKRLAVARLGVPEDRITVCVPGAADLQPRAECPTLGPILHVGTVEPRKNVGALLEAYADLMRTRPVPPLLFAGRVADGSRLEMPGVQYLGYVGAEAKMQLYREASMLVIPSLDEGFGIPALEAMTVGVPVVAAARGALPEVIGDAGMLVDGETAGEFQRALSLAVARVLDDAELRREMVARGRERAHRFSWDTSATRAREAFAAAVARRNQRP